VTVVEDDAVIDALAPCAGTPCRSRSWTTRDHLLSRRTRSAPVIMRWPSCGRFPAAPAFPASSASLPPVNTISRLHPACPGSACAYHSTASRRCRPQPARVRRSPGNFKTTKSRQATSRHAPPDRAPWAAWRRHHPGPA
jgi:hypothetical protein